jgi:hypothetical protein
VTLPLIDVWSLADHAGDLVSALLAIIDALRPHVLWFGPGAVALGVYGVRWWRAWR